LATSLNVIDWGRDLVTEILSGQRRSGAGTGHRADYRIAIPVPDIRAGKG
jgi:hypothetical protein